MPWTRAITGRNRLAIVCAIVAFAMLSVGLSSDVRAQTDCRLVPPARQERRLALVVGNDTYGEAPLRNARSDARAVARALEDVGFRVTLVEDATRQALGTAVAVFGNALQPTDVALFYFAGHGVQVDAENFLIPSDFAGHSASEVRLNAVKASEIQQLLQPARVALLILDACRNNPFAGTRGGTGLAAMETQGSLIAFATGAGQTAADGSAGSNGLFTTELLKVLREPGLTVQEVFQRVRRGVYTASAGKQFPAVYDGLLGDDFVFRSGARPATASATPMVDDLALARREELTFWESIKDSRSRSVFEDYLTRYGDKGRFAVVARDKLDELRRPTPGPSPSPPPKPSASAPPPVVPSPARVAPSPTPATVRRFSADAGMVLNFIKPDKTADFEAVMAKLKEAMQKSDKPERKQQAATWKVFKSPEPAGANSLYVFVIEPSVKDADYTVSNILAEAFPPAELNTIYKQYADSYAQGQNIINLQLVIDMASPPTSAGPTRTFTGDATRAPPTKRVFISDAGMVLNFIKPDKTADFEAVMAKLKEAMQKSDKPERKQQAATWKVFKSPEPAGANSLYVFVIEPSVKDADYTVSNILAEAFPPAELNTIYKQYADSYAQGQNIINLNLVTAFGK